MTASPGPPRPVAALLTTGLLLALVGCDRSPAPQSPEPATPEASVAEIFEIHGSGQIKERGAEGWADLAPGTRLGPGDRIRCDSGSLSLRFGNGEMQTLKAGTVLQVQGHGAEGAGQPVTGGSPDAAPAG